MAPIPLARSSAETRLTAGMKFTLLRNEAPTSTSWAKLAAVRNQYPHPFPNDDSKGVKLNFPKDCPADDSRYEFPLMNGSPYDGGKNNVKQGDERVVFYYEDGEISYDGNPQVYYCGIMTHKGAATGGFLMC
ncbi:hypothetical protein KNSL1_011064 [Colletotrichum chrysophilum]|nr:hypothetical protein KNSL1_011064 [Colletotrichum chrysophilum]